MHTYSHSEAYVQVRAHTRTGTEKLPLCSALLQLAKGTPSLYHGLLHHEFMFGYSDHGFHEGKSEELRKGIKRA
eukprot:1156598-Pelagomonas_calceolata.AAC.5